MPCEDELLRHKKKIIRMGYSVYTTIDPNFRGQAREESGLSNPKSGDRLGYLFIIHSI